MTTKPKPLRKPSLNKVVYPAWVLDDVAHAYEEARCPSCSGEAEGRCERDHWEDRTEWNKLSAAAQWDFYIAAENALGNSTMGEAGRDVLHQVMANASVKPDEPAEQPEVL